MSATAFDQSAFLATVQADPEAPGLVDHLPIGAAAPEPVTATVTGTPTTAVLAPAGVDPHRMPVTAIVFDPALLDGLPGDLRGDDLAEASRLVFALYKSKPKDPQRNRDLHEAIGWFIQRVRTERGHAKPVRPVRAAILARQADPA